MASGGATQKLDSYIDVTCVFALEADFEGIDWGTVTPGFRDVAAGDLIWDDPPGNAPTLKNIGNDGMGLRLEFTEMVGISEGQVIGRFDAKYGRAPSILKSLDPIMAGDVADFGTEPGQVLCANELGKLDVSIHPPRVLPADSYHGQLTVTGYHVEGECAGDQHM
ncbi:MAG: hypothetical protein ACOC5K_03505 [Chloroflexota bacterium]